MAATNGVPTELTGLPGVDPDALINRIESLARDGLDPRIIGLRIRPISLSKGGNAVVVRIPKSWNPPHRVSTGNTNRFYLRNSGGVHEASVEELRVLFNTSATTQDRIQNFRLERISKVDARRGPAVLPLGRIFVHVLPYSAFGTIRPIDLEAAFALHHQFRPLSSMGMTPRFNLDGVINVRGGEVCYGYTQLFRNGIVEATRGGILRDLGSERILPAGTTGNEIIEAIPLFLEGLRTLGVPPPLVVMVSYHGVVGAKLGVYQQHQLDGIEPLPNEDPLLLPEVIMNEYGSKSDCIGTLKPIFDALWNAAGFSRCTYFDASGAWKPPR